MKRTTLVVAALLFTGLVACGDSEKSAEDIQEEYATNESTSDENNHAEEIENNTTNNNETSSESEYEYIEDFAALNTRTKLYETLDPNYLVDGSEWYAEGTVEFQVTTYYDPNTLNEYRLVWDQDNNEDLAFIEVYLNLYEEASGTVRQQFVLSESGVFTGMTIKELYEWNKQNDIKFSGFGWDFGGGVFPQEGTPIANSGLTFRLGLDDYMDETYTYLMGDMELSTSSEGVMDAPIRVDMLTLYVNDVEM